MPVNTSFQAASVKIHGSRWKKYVVSVLKRLTENYFLRIYIGLSGCLLFGIQRACDSSSNLDNITNRIDSLRYDIHENTKTLQNACKRDTSLIKIRTKNNVIIKE